MESLQRLRRERWNVNSIILPNLILLRNDNDSACCMCNGARRAVWNLNRLFGVASVKLYRTSRVVRDTQLTCNTTSKKCGNCYISAHK